MSIVEVDCSDLLSHPRCPHGPMIKFTKVSKSGSQFSFFGCSGCRDPKDCFTVGLDEKLSQSKKKAMEQLKMLFIRENHNQKASQDVLRRIKSLSKKKRRFCQSCFEFILPSKLSQHENHQIVERIDDLTLSRPSNFLAAKTQNKIEAQYWFDDTTKGFIVSLISQLKVNSVLCIGAPTIHELLRNGKIKSLLLDMDSRYMTFYDKSEFIWFNMMNSHFFLDEDKSLRDLTSFCQDGRICTVIDPPFGARLEMLSRTIRIVSSLCSNQMLVFLVLPYFMEPQVLKHLPNFQMLDYVVHYNNHPKMKSHKRSAVRLFTNVPPSEVPLPSEEGYIFCPLCRRWRHPANRHCDLCSDCPSKNGTTYKHCDSCNVCVKSTWAHCDKCQRCFLAPHKCERFGVKRKKMENPPVKKRAKTS